MATALRLDLLPMRSPATIRAIDWTALEAGDARRLRNLGFEDGVAVEPLHAAPVSQDPIAVRVGRMTVAIRRAHARAMTVDYAPVEAA